MLTCYDYSAAVQVEQSLVDCVLVGDSVAMVVHGAENTTTATLEMMSMHTAAVAKGIKTKFIIGDLPFMSYRKSLSESMHAVEQLVRSGAHAIKLEGVDGNVDLIKHIVASGVPVMGHIGLTPQHVHALGGFKVQGKTQMAQTILLNQAKQLVVCGCFALVLECIPAGLAAKITQAINIPTIGIGAGPATDGQVLVWHDLLGLSTGFKPRFVKQYLQGNELITAGINCFVEEVKQLVFPSKVHTYKEQVVENHTHCS
jgi:3-methyl-2-oxobutanoate hydroxymethyltransferase